ncbi:DNA-repair protein complementing XP-A cells [Entomortierella parvispora]|uniref:DNA-repair protein complementing XP-A cells n=1 Tax=Entomortierella parvispora TaxID=205924 RepID=A0A9P3HKT9_9FUNG|nr:DNA-repair protein complementing XP-A cells [Entomortierella parvispora]
MGSSNTPTDLASWSSRAEHKTSTDSHSSATSAKMASSGSSSDATHLESEGRHVSKSEISPEIQAKIERNRQAALERRAKFQKRQESERAIAEALADSGTPSTGGAFGKDTAAVIKAIEAIEPLPKNDWTKFYDYDLSKMKDTRAGFIKEVEEPSSAKSATAADDESSRKRKWQPTIVQQDPSIFLGAQDNYECQDCGSLDVDFQLLTHFHVPVCISCRDSQPEKYSLLTKTECRQDYLLTDPELRDTELFPFWERPNPKKSTWNNMMLYLRCQVEEFAFKKWNGPEGLDQEFERRERDKEARKELKFKKELRDLRNKTRTSVWQDKKLRNRAKVHKHDYGAALVDPSTGASVQTCIECGIQVECEEF